MREMIARNEVIRQLQQEVLLMQGLKKPIGNQHINTNLGVIEEAFPAKRFPTGAIHEFISYRNEDAASTNAFITVLIKNLILSKAPCIWVGGKHSTFPPALKKFGIDPDRFIFIDLFRNKEILWTIEEALKCDSVSAVIGDLKELSFNESRRFQLAVENSNVTGFIHRYGPRTENPTACVSRWKIMQLASGIYKNIPGVGFSRWNVELNKVRNGTPRSWQFEWRSSGLRQVLPDTYSIPDTYKLKTG